MSHSHIMLFISTLHPTVHMYISLWILHILNIKTKQWQSKQGCTCIWQVPPHLFALYLTLCLIRMMCTGSHIPGEDSETNTHTRTPTAHQTTGKPIHHPACEEDRIQRRSSEHLCLLLIRFQSILIICVSLSFGLDNATAFSLLCHIFHSCSQQVFKQH